MGKTLIKDRDHDHYFVDSGYLWECYDTIRGLRNRVIMRVAPGTPDMDQVESEVLKLFEQEYDKYNESITKRT